MPRPADLTDDRLPTVVRCGACKRERPFAEFSRNWSRPPTYSQPYCDDCRKTQNREVVMPRRKQRLTDIPESKHCPTCCDPGELLPSSYFWSDAARHDGLQPHCKTCQVIYRRGRYMPKEYPELNDGSAAKAYQAAIRALREENPERYQERFEEALERIMAGEEL